MKKSMLRLLAGTLAVLLLCPAFCVRAALPETQAACAVLLEPVSGRVLYAKNETEPAAMASTTKMMTALLTLEAAETNDRPVRVTEEMIAVEGSSLGLRAGDEITLSNLAAGMLTVSGNDAARAAAIALAGSEAAFADRMNERATQLGLQNTSFETASGLDGENHFSTALDLARLAAEALKNPRFAAIVSQPETTVAWKTPAKSAAFKNHNRLLTELNGCIGVKTGYTDKAGRCLVSAVEREGVRLICVTLHDPDDWEDHTALYEAAFSQMRFAAPEEFLLPGTLPAVGGVLPRVPLKCETVPDIPLFDASEKLTCRITAPPFVYAPVMQGETLARAELYVNDCRAAVLELKAACTILQQKQEKTWWQKLLSLLRIGE